MSEFEEAKEAYAAIGVDAEEALKKLQQVRISMHCWQGDDVLGFDSDALTGGIATTGNYPGRARTPEELMADIRKAYSLIPGKHKLNLHASYRITKEKVDRDKIEPRHFASWVDFAKEEGIGLDFNPTFFSHKNVKDNMTLSSPDPAIREFWIAHGKACRKIANYFGEELGITALDNIWIPDGTKDVPADRIGPRARLKEALDEILSVPYDRKNIADSVEGKVFGIGVESYTVGSHEFYMNYAARKGIMCLLDTGHYHPTEVVSDKISSMLLFNDSLALHVSRPVRWDSDHVTIMNDDTLDLCKEIVRCNALNRVHIGLDYFDASINRIGAYVIGSRATQKCLLQALLEPLETLRRYEAEEKGFERLALLEECKSLPWNAVWDMFCLRNGVPVGEEFIAGVDEYEAEVTSKRK